jgi:hypothetical protein
MDICDFKTESLVVITKVSNHRLREVGFLEGKRIKIDRTGRPCIVRFDSGMKVAVGDGAVFAKLEAKDANARDSGDGKLSRRE